MTTTVAPHLGGNASPQAPSRARYVLLLLCGAQFLVVLDSSIVNVALPSIQRSLHFSQQNLQWVTSAYALTFAGFLLLGGRSADLLGRRRVFFTGLGVFLLSSFVGGLAGSSAMLVAARAAQGLGGAMMSPSALSLVNTTFHGAERTKAIGIYGAMGGVGGAAGVLFGGVLTSGLGWRSVLFVNVPFGLAIAYGAARLIPDDRRRAQAREFDVPGAMLVTAALLLLVYALTQAPNVGWSTSRTELELAGAALLLLTFLANETRARRPLLPLSTFRLPGVAIANTAAVLIFSGMIPLFFFLTLYMQQVLGYSALRAGLAFLPLTLGVIAVTRNTARLIARFGPRPTLIFGPLVFSSGLFWLSKVPVHGHYLTDVLPGLLVCSVGAGVSLVSVITAATRGVPPQNAGVAAGLVNTMQRVGTAVGLAVLTDIASSRTTQLLGHHTTQLGALTSGFDRALFAAALFALAASALSAATVRSRLAIAPAPPPASPQPAPTPAT